MTRARYMARLLGLARQGAFPDGAVTHVEVSHDDDCPRPDGGPCTCSPTIAWGPDVQRRGWGREGARARGPR